MKVNTISMILVAMFVVAPAFAGQKKVHCNVNGTVSEMTKKECKAAGGTVEKASKAKK